VYNVEFITYRSLSLFILIDPYRAYYQEIMVWTIGFILFWLLLKVNHAESLQAIRIPRFQKKINKINQPHLTTITMDSIKMENRTVDEYLMGLALDQAKIAGEHGEVPIGALIAYTPSNGAHNDILPSTNITIVSTGKNQIENLQDASAHAELQALRSAANTMQNWRLINCTLYTTLEPCPMCLSACQAFRISRIVYGAPDLRLGATGTYINLLEHQHPFHDSMEIVRGIRGEEAKELLVNFFRKRRKGKREITNYDDKKALNRYIIVKRVIQWLRQTEVN
jgi:tRNA(adenine34) deaminase